MSIQYLLLRRAPQRASFWNDKGKSLTIWASSIAALQKVADLGVVHTALDHSTQRSVLEKILGQMIFLDIAMHPPLAAMGSARLQ